jgi:hypothetical protein
MFLGYDNAYISKSFALATRRDACAGIRLAPTFATDVTRFEVSAMAGPRGKRLCVVDPFLHTITYYILHVRRLVLCSSCCASASTALQYMAWMDAAVYRV